MSGHVGTVVLLGHVGHPVCPPGTVEVSNNSLIVFQLKFLNFCLYHAALRDPGLGAFLTPGSGMGESQYPDPGSGMNNPDHIF